MVQVLANDMVRCTPDRGSVHSGNTLDLELTLNFMEPQVVSTQLIVEVRGGKVVKMPIKGEAVLPAIDIGEAILDMGEVYTGVVSRLPLTVINTTPVVAGESATFITHLACSKFQACWQVASVISKCHSWW